MRKAIMTLGFTLAAIAMLLPEPAAALRWGNATESGVMSGCTGPDKCTRQYSAILWDIPWGANWEETCRRTPHPKFGRVPDYCMTTTNVWGNWVVRRDPYCGAWCK